jgi:MYXO-CTERM domain-containing protein
MQDAPNEVVAGPLALLALALLAASVRRRSFALGAAACAATVLELRWTSYRRYVRDPRRADLRFVTYRP